MERLGTGSGSEVGSVQTVPVASGHLSCLVGGLKPRFDSLPAEDDEQYRGHKFEVASRLAIYIYYGRHTAFMSCFERYRAFLLGHLKPPAVRREGFAQLRPTWPQSVFYWPKAGSSGLATLRPSTDVRCGTHDPHLYERSSFKSSGLTSSIAVQMSRTQPTQLQCTDKIGNDVL